MLLGSSYKNAVFAIVHRLKIAQYYEWMDGASMLITIFVLKYRVYANGTQAITILTFVRFSGKGRHILHYKNSRMQIFLC